MIVRLFPLAPDELVARIGAICDEFECYGYRRVGAALRQQGIVVNGKKLRRLMREHDLQRRDGGATSSPPTATTPGRSSPIVTTQVAVGSGGAEFRDQMVWITGQGGEEIPSLLAGGG